MIDFASSSNRQCPRELPHSLFGVDMRSLAFFLPESKNDNVRPQGSSGLPQAAAVGSVGTNGGCAASYPAGMAGRAAQPPGLDLSLGHFGTSGAGVQEIDVVNFGPFTVFVDYGAMTVEVDLESSPPVSRQIRRAARRKVDRLVAEAQRAGMTLVGEVADADSQGGR